MPVAILIPWRSTDCPHRRRALGWVVAELAPLGWPIIVGRHDEGPWCKALAVADAFAQTDAEVLVIHDADVVTTGLAVAVRTVQNGAAWAVPHRGVHRLSEATTSLYMAGRDPASLELDERAYRGVEGGGITVVRRDVYEDWPLDPRFLGWSGEDEAFGWALRTLHGPPWRPTTYAPLVHLWHPPQERATRARGSMESWELRKRYARAQHNPVAMRALIQEVTDGPSGPVELAGDDHRALRR